MTKQRLSASVDVSMIKAAEEAVARGVAPNVSAWVNDAMRLKLEHDRKLASLRELVADYESTYGVISDEEMRVAVRKARGGSLVRDTPRRTRRTR